MYSIDENASAGEKLDLSQLHDGKFWARIDDLVDILKPLYEAQKMSESGTAGVQYVYKRWQECKRELRKLADSNNFHSADLQKYMRPTNEKGWFARYKRQVHAIHLVAFKLEPANRKAAFTGREREIAKEWLQKQEHGKELYEQYVEYLAGDGEFGEMDTDISTKTYWHEKARFTLYEHT